MSRARRPGGQFRRLAVLIAVNFVDMIGFMIVLRFGFRTLENIRALPFSEQLTMGLNGGNVSGEIGLYSLLALVFLLFRPQGLLGGSGADQGQRVFDRGGRRRGR